MSQIPYLSLIIPAYNEAQRLPTTLDAVYGYLSQQSFTWEIIVVLDGGTDDTKGVVERFSADKPNIHLIERKENMGKGYTVRQGMLAATGQIRLYTDADNSTDMSHFDKMKPLFDAGQHVVICSRDSKDAADAQQAVPQPFSKRLLGNMGNLFIQLMAVPRIWDTQCGFKAFSAESAEKIFPIATINEWGFDIEILALARNFGYDITPVGAHWINDEGSKVRFSAYFKTLLETVNIRWNLMTGKYKG